MASRNVFRLVDLPAELRELIYCYSAEDLPAIDTAAIKNHGIAKVPVIAALSRAIREEVLAVLYRNRELLFSFHCERNIERGEQWLRAAGDDAEMPCTVVFAGVLKQTSEFCHLTVHCSDKQPYFQVTARPSGSADTQLLCEELTQLVKEYLSNQAACKTGKSVGKLYGREVKDIFALVCTESNWKRQRVARQPGTPMSVQMANYMRSRGRG